MKRINLLPTTYKEQIHIRRIIKIQLLVFLAAAFFVALSYLLPATLFKARQSSLAKLEQQANDPKYVQTEAVAEAILSLQAEIESYQYILQELTAQQSVDMQVFTDLSALLPSGAKITSFLINTKSCSLQGQSQSRADAIGFINSAEKLSYIKEIQIKSISLETEHKPVTFSIEIGMLPMQ